MELYATLFCIFQVSCKCVIMLCLLSRFSHVWLCDPMDCSLPGSSVHGILQVRILEWVALPSSRDQTRISCVFCIAGRFFNTEPLGKFKINYTFIIKKNIFFKELSSPLQLGSFLRVSVCLSSLFPIILSLRLCVKNVSYQSFSFPFLFSYR